jgi:pyridoxal phosphate-dependent aminotransferase EpsN
MASTPRKRVLLSVPHMGGSELRYLQEAFASNWLSTVGPNLEHLEREFSAIIGLPSVALASGTAGMHLGLRLLGVRAGDEVVSPTLTFAASCNPILYEHATPVFLDSERTSWNLDPNLLAEFLTKRARVNKLPRAVIVVHLFGQSADLDPLLETCRLYDVPVLEDAAEALGASYKGKPPGSLGDIGVFSFNGNKIITGTSGGMLVSPRAESVAKARFWSTQARDPDPLNNYVHSELGYNYRLSNVLAGIVRGQLEVLPLRVEQRRNIAFRYRDALAAIPGFELMPQAPYGIHTNWLSCFLIDEGPFGLNQAQLIKYLDSQQIETRPVWKPMHTQPLYSGYECIGGAVAEEINCRGICLPSSSSLSGEDQDYVIEKIIEAHSTAGAIRARLS